MPSSRGRAAMDRFFNQLPEQIERQLLRGAGRAAATVVADEARARAPAHETKELIAIRSKTEPGQITVRVVVNPGWGRTLGIWSEYGTDPHFISVDDSQRGGRGIRRINKQVKEDGGGSLVINGKFVGSTVFHPGARADPFMRPALDLKKDEALAAAQSFINARISGGRIKPGAGAGGDDE